jgi:hypothetical protein
MFVLIFCENLRTAKGAAWTELSKKLQRDKLRKELQTMPANVPPELPETDATFWEQLHLREADYYFRSHRAASPRQSGPCEGD